MSRIDKELTAIAPGTSKWIMPESQTDNDILRYDEVEADEIRSSGLTIDNEQTAYKLGKQRVVGMLVRRPLE